MIYYTYLIYHKKEYLQRKTGLTISEDFLEPPFQGGFADHSFHGGHGGSVPEENKGGDDIRPVSVRQKRGFVDLYFKKADTLPMAGGDVLYDRFCHGTFPAPAGVEQDYCRAGVF